MRRVLDGCEKWGLSVFVLAGVAGLLLVSPLAFVLVVVGLLVVFAASLWMGARVEEALSWEE